MFVMYLILLKCTAKQLLLSELFLFQNLKIYQPRSV
jgi:hypothetical protein